MMHASAQDATIMNMMTICSRAACSTSAPPRIAPDIIPGIAMIPVTLAPIMSFKLVKPGTVRRTSFG